MPTTTMAELAADLSIPKSSVNREFLNRDLVVANPDYLTALKHTYSGKTDVPETLQFYGETETHFLLPRNYRNGFDLSLYKVKDKSTIGLPLGKEIVEHIVLRDYQEDYIQRVHTDAERDCILNVPCGHGKTVLALWLTAKRQCRTIVFVTTNALANQWASRVSTFLEVSFLVVTAKTKPEELLANDFVVTTFDAYKARKDAFKELGVQESFGQIILDESHRTGAATYYPVMQDFPCYYRLALSATFRRSDGLEQILSYEFGRAYKMKSVFPKPQTYLWDFGLADDEQGYEGVNVVVKFPAEEYRKLKPALNQAFPSAVYSAPLFAVCNLYDDPWDSFDFAHKAYEKKAIHKVYRGLGNVSYSNLDTFAAQLPQYKAWVCRIVRNLVWRGRRPLLLSKRISLLYDVANYLLEQGFNHDEVCVITGKGNKHKYSTDETNARCVLGIVQIAGEGLDIDYLDTLVLAHPIKDIEQAYGRIRRVLPGKKPPVVIQPYNWSVYYNRLQNFKSPIFRENSEPPVIIKSLPDGI